MMIQSPPLEEQLELPIRPTQQSHMTPTALLHSLHTYQHSTEPNGVTEFALTVASQDTPSPTVDSIY